MNKHAGGFRLAAALLMVVMLLCASFALAEEDPIRVSSLCEPQTVMTEQDVSITIKVYNSSQSDIQQDITLFNPVGVSVEKFSGLKGEQSATYTGEWHVTSDQIAKGRISYYIRYTIGEGDAAKETTRTVPVTIKTEAAKPELSATYAISQTSARKGQEISLAYTLSNTGNVELRDIEIENKGVSSKKLTAASLSAGEKVTLEDSFTMGDKELVSQPVITYQSAESSQRLTIDDMAKRTITVAEEDILVTLTSSGADKAYPGEPVDFTVEVKNKGRNTYSGLSVTTSTGTVIESDLELKANTSFKAEFDEAFDAAGQMIVTVEGVSAKGDAVGAASEPVAIQVQDASRALVLEVAAQAQQNTISAEPAVVRFAVQVKNVGQTDATTLTIREAGTTVATIPALAAGEQKLVVFDVETSIGGKFQFVVSGKDADGNEKKYESNIIEVAYLAPTPAPTATPGPTAVPPTPSPVPTATPEPTVVDRINEVVNTITENVDPKVLYIAGGVLAGVLALLIGVSVASSAKHKKILANSIDTIELTGDTRNHRGEKRSGKRPEKAAKPSQTAETPEPIVYASELTEEDTKTVKHQESAPQDDGRRRRAAQEAAQEAANAQETLRVVPVDERPEFMAQQPVNDSKTRIFGHLTEEAILAAETKQEEEPKPEEKPAENVGSDTLRFSHEQMEELNRKQDETAAKGKKRSEIKPMKKKKKSFFFGRHKEEDDFVDEDDAQTPADDDDLFE